jgi:hypothetical protein
MKKVMNICLAVLLLGLAVPALAEYESCDVDFNVQVDKKVYIDQCIFVKKDLDLKVDVRTDPDEWAQCEVYKCDLNKGNEVFEIFDPLLIPCDLNVDTIYNSFNGFSGIAQVNQSAGSLNNQGNITAIAVTNNDKVKDRWGAWGERERSSLGLSHTEVAVEQVNTDNCLVSILTTHRDTIEGSFTNFRGIAQVNQAAGFMNNQNNVVGLSANLNDGVVALSDAFLTQSNTENKATFVAVNYSAAINSSFNGSTGIAQVNQAPGSMNNQANIVSFSYAGVTRPQ